MLERLVAQTWYVAQLSARTEGAMLVAPGNDVGGQRRVEARDARQQRHRCGIHVDADGIDAVLDHGVERAGELRLVDVVLVLADADRLGIDLHQLGERVLNPAGDGHGAAQRDVEIGELQCRQLGCRIDRGAGLGDDDLGQAQLGGTMDQFTGELVGFA